MLLGQILGGVGVVLLLSMPLTFLIAGQAGAVTYVKLLLGIGFIGYYLATNRDRARQTLGNRSTGLLFISGATVVFFLGGLAALNFIAFKNPKEIDLTRDGLYTLADQTLKTLKGLNQEVTVHAFYNSVEPQRAQAKATLERFAVFGGDKLKIEFVDPMKNPELVEKFQIREGGSRIVFTAANAHEARPKDLSEQELTNALIKVTSGQEKKIYFLTGHGETDINDQTELGASVAVQALRNEGYTVDVYSFAAGGTLGGDVDLNAAAQQAPEPVIPADAHAIVVLSPKVALSAGEVNALSKFAERGGKLFVTLEARRETGLEALAAKWHVAARNDLVVDRNPVTQMLGMPPTMALVQSFEEHPITKDFRSPIALPSSRSLEVTEKAPGALPKVSAKGLAFTGKTSWGESDFTSNVARFDEGKDATGPLAIVAVSTLTTASVTDKLSDEGRVIIAGDGEFVTNKYIELQANADFFVNSLNYLADEEGKISIRPKTRGANRLMLTERDSDVIKFFSMDILPVSILALGVAVRGVRRRK